MDAKELRIGNLVKINNSLLIETENEIYKIIGFNERTDWEFPDSDGVISLQHIESIRTYSQFSQFIEPIPLTEEWLLKFGFEYDSIIWGKELLMLSPNETFFNIWVETLTYGRLEIEMRYVHQLQNLYFALTGEELNYTK